ncbi:MAG: hypothetical protein ACRCZM_10905 [Bacteroidales bacterium]
MLRSSNDCDAIALYPKGNIWVTAGKHSDPWLMLSALLYATPPDAKRITQHTKGRHSHVGGWSNV